MRSLIGLLVVLVSTSIAAAQAQCPAAVENALNTSLATCDTLGRNQVCYGHVLLDATLRRPDLLFNQPGDRINAADIDSLVTSPLNLDANTWGIALLSLQANLPDSLPGQNVSVVVFGDVSLTSETDSTAPSARITGTAARSANVRSAPSTSGEILGGLVTGTPVTLVGRSAAGDWAAVEFAEGRGWVSASLLRIEGDINSLPVVNTFKQYTAPMQAFRFRSGIGDSTCEEVPDSGLLIQSPQGITVNFLINGVEVDLGSTVLIRQAAGDATVFTNLVGRVRLTSAGVTTELRPGESAGVPPGGPPGDARPYTADEVTALPLPLLPQAVGLPPNILSIGAFNVVGNGAVNIFPITFINPDGDAIVGLVQTLIAATGGNWYSGDVAVRPQDYDNASGGTLQYPFVCRTTQAYTVTYEIALVDAGGNIGAPMRYTATCSPP
jgi:uncharacterized protein YgiM (DUF1202 family)